MMYSFVINSRIENLKRLQQKTNQNMTTSTTNSNQPSLSQQAIKHMGGNHHEGRNIFLDCRDELSSESIDESAIFRDMPDPTYTPIEESNDTAYSRIALSPAWSQDSTDDRNLFDTMKLEQAAICIYCDATTSDSVSHISDFAMDSGRIQQLKF